MIELYEEKSGPLGERVKITEIDFGIVEAGKIKQKKLFMKNTSPNYTRIYKVISSNPNLIVLNFTKALKANDWGELLLEWKCPLDLRSGLKGELTFEGTVIYE